MKVLFITTNCYPREGTCSNLINKLLFDGALLEKFEKVTVVSGKLSINDPDEELINGVSVLRAETWSLIKRSDLKHIARESLINAIMGFNSKAIKYLEEKVFKSHFLDSQLVKCFYEKIRAIGVDEYDVVITVSGRYEATKAALKVAKSMRKPLFLYQVDPCSTNASYHVKSDKLRRQFEKELFDYATRILTLPTTYHEMKTYLQNDILSKVVKTELPLIIKPENVSTNNSSEIKCMFLGSIYRGIRDPRYTFKLFDSIDDYVRLELVGVERQQVYWYIKDDNYIFHGRVDIAEAMRMMQEEADVLVNIGNSNINQIPSKIFEYMSTGKPIVNICKSRECPTLRYLSKYPLALNLFEETDILGEQTDKLKLFLKQHGHDVIPYNLVEDIFQDCTPNYLAKQFEEVLSL